jgi:broad specificity phosphatase PhoE
VRSVISDLRLDHAGNDVVVVSHQAVIMLFRYVLERLDEPTLLALDKREQVANTAVCTYEAAPDGELRLVTWNDTRHLPDAATTDDSDLPVAPR